MKTIKIPTFFHEILGESQTKIELITIMCFAVVATATVLYGTMSEWTSLSALKLSVLILLYFDISGGVIANLSYGTNQHYKVSVKRRLIFIAIHIQPLLLSLVFSNSWWICFSVWGYTIISSLLVNQFYGHPSQKIIGGLMLFIGLIGLQLIPANIVALQIILMLFMIKVIYSFSVDHYASR